MDGWFYGVSVAKSAWAVEYTDCISAEREDLPNEYPGYDTKQTHGEVPLMLVLWGIWSSPSLLSLPVPLWPGFGAPDRVQCMSQIELNFVLMQN